MSDSATRIRTAAVGSACGCGGHLARHLAALLPLPRAVSEGKVDRSRPPRSLGTTVIRGATVLPVDADFTEAEAVAFRDGRIIAVGTESEVRDLAGPEAEVLDRPGVTILPGFIEPHAHVLPAAVLDEFHDVGPFRFDTVDEVLAHLRAEVSEAGDVWVCGRQFDPSLQAGPDELTLDMLDSVSETVPVLVVNASGHLAYANSAALAVAGIDEDTPDLDGSPYGRNSDSSPNGVLMGQPAMFSVLGLNPALAGIDILARAADVCRRASKVGVTMICDQGAGFLFGPGDVDIYQSLASAGDLSTRLRYSVYDVNGDGFDTAGIVPGHGDELIRSVGWKIVSDGSNQGRTGHQRDPYPGTDDRGFAYVEPADLVEKARRRSAQGWQIVIHANGDQAIDDAIDALEAAANSSGADPRHRIEHCSILHDDQIRRIAEYGISPSFLIGHVYYWGQAFRDEIFGPEKTQMLDRTASCSEAGVRWTIHSDEMVTPIGPLRCIHNAVSRELWREPDVVLNPDERVSIEAGIRSMTSEAAWQCHSEHEIGSLEVGKMADLVVLDRDPRTVDPSALQSIQVLETWMDGELRYSDATN